MEQRTCRMLRNQWTITLKQRYFRNRYCSDGVLFLLAQYVLTNTEIFHCFACAVNNVQTVYESLIETM